MLMKKMIIYALKKVLHSATVVPRAVATQTKGSPSSGDEALGIKLLLHRSR